MNTCHCIAAHSPHFLPFFLLIFSSSDFLGLFYSWCFLEGTILW